MNVDALDNSPIGRLVPIQGTDARYGDFACFAYLPDPLPSTVELLPESWAAVASATAALARLDQACTQLADPALLIRPALWREALDTSALEGTYGQLTEILEAQLPSSQFQSPETREIRAYESVALAAFEAVKERAISVSLLSGAQGELFANIDTKSRDVGMVRQHQVWIGPENTPIGEARFVPPPGDDRLRSALELWTEWVDTDSILPAVLRAALAHYQFETLHPFGDGNGRIGRLAIVLQLLRANEIRYPAVTVSPWLLKRRSEYQELMLSLSCTGDWNPWVQFFCQAISEQSKRMIDGAEKLTMWLSGSRTSLNEKRWTGKIHQVLEGLTRWPVITISFAATQYGMTPMAATKIVNHLVEVGVLDELTGGSYARVFGAVRVMEIVDEI